MKLFINVFVPKYQYIIRVYVVILFLSPALLICHILLHLSVEAKHGLWLSIPSMPGLTDPSAVILDFMMAEPKN